MPALAASLALGQGIPLARGIAAVRHQQQGGGPKQREDAICREHHTVFLMQIGGNLKRSGQPHDGRAPDYDDWRLNGDILLWNPVLERSFEISYTNRTFILRCMTTFDALTALKERAAGNATLERIYEEQCKTLGGMPPSP